MQEWEEILELIKKQIRKQDRSYEEYLKETYAPYQYICIFGVGNIGTVTAQELMKRGIKVDFFCDNDIEKNGRSFLGIPCYLPEKLEAVKDDTMVLIATRYFREIDRQLKGMGVKHTDRVFTNKFEVAKKLEQLGRESVIDHIVDVVELLEDEKSKYVYTMIVKNWLTLDHSQEEIDRVFTDDQYFCKDVFPLNEYEYFVDGGAYDGDTFAMFYRETKGKFKGAHLFELSEANYKKLLENIAEYHEPVRDRVCCVNKGLAEKEAVIRYCDKDEGSTVDSIGDTVGYLTGIDEACMEAPVTYIKMDIEGSEKQALCGARITIQEKKPKLAVCLYHKFEDLWELPLYIHELLPEYRLFIRHHTDLLNETVCYATV